MPHEPYDLPKWERRLKAMKRCRSTAQLIARQGKPAHRVVIEAEEIWHYPLGIAGGTLYSIHVHVHGDRPMAYMHMEPTDQPDTAASRRWWQVWRGR